MFEEFHVRKLMFEKSKKEKKYTRTIRASQAGSQTAIHGFDKQTIKRKKKRIFFKF